MSPTSPPDRGTSSLPGVDGEGFIIREASADKVPRPYLPVVDGLIACCRRALGARFHSLYLYGSVATGVAVPGRSDLDALALLSAEPRPEHRRRLRSTTEALALEHPFVTEVGVILFSADAILSPPERYDMGFFLRCLCACVHGEDLGPRLPEYRPTLELAAGTNGNVGAVLAAARARLAEAGAAGEVQAVCRGVSRKIVRTGFTLVMPRERVWTNSLPESCRLFVKHYPDRAEQMHEALRLALAPIANRDTVARMIDHLGAWLTQEYSAAILSRVPAAETRDPEPSLRPGQLERHGPANQADGRR
jgi:predicted nucleotidyltransferase